MAAYPTATGQPELTGSWLPRLYSAQILVEYYPSLTFAAISNTDYEGQIKQQGDTVRIRTLPDIPINTHVKGQDLEYAKPEPGFIDLEINEGRSFSFSTDAVDVKQSDLPFAEKWQAHAARGLANETDTEIFANVFADAHVRNKGVSAGVESQDINLGVAGTPLQLTKTNILEKLVDCRTVLGEQNAPPDGRWIVIPTWAGGMLMKSDLKDASMMGDGTSALRNGRLGMIGNFTIYESNNLAKTVDGADTVFNAVFGHKDSLTFASQMTESDVIKNPFAFGTLYRSLHVFGYKVVKPEAMGHLYIKK